MTLERFLKWKADFMKEMEKDKPIVEKKTDRKLTGREMFTANPELEGLEEADGGVSIYDTIDIKNRRQDEQEESNKNVEIDEDLFNADDIEDLEDLEDELNDLSVNDK